MSLLTMDLCNSIKLRLIFNIYSKANTCYCFPILAHLISHYVSNYASILYTVPVLRVLPIIHVCTRPVANKERNFRNPWFLPGIQTHIASNFDLLVSNCQGKEIPSFLSVSYLISESWDAFNIRFVILGTERCYASVIILRKAIGRAKKKQTKKSDGAKRLCRRLTK